MSGVERLDGRPLPSFEKRPGDERRLYISAQKVAASGGKFRQILFRLSSEKFQRHSRGAAGSHRTSRLVKLLRWFLLLLAAVGLLLALVALDPWAQTQIAQSWLNRQPGFRGTVESVSARWSEVALKDLRLKFEGATFILPNVTVGVPVKEALLEGRLPVRQLIAKGWTLDLDPPAAKTPLGKTTTPAVTPATTPLAATAETPSRNVHLARQLVAGLNALLNAPGWEREISFDGVDFDGDVKLPAPKGGEAVWFHVILRGGGLAAGREGDFTIQLSELNAPPATPPWQARLRLRMDAARAFDRIRIETTPAGAGKSSSALTFALEATAARRVGDESYAFEIKREDRTVLELHTQRHTATGDLAGTWKLGALDQDRAALTSLPASLSLEANGGGVFTADASFTRLEMSGEATALASDRGTALSALGTVSAASRFALTLQGSVLRLARFDATLTGAAPLATLTLKQPVDFDTRTRQFTAINATAEWLQVSLQGLPLTLVPALPAPWRLSGGTVSGEASVSGSAGTMVVRTKVPLAATGVAIAREGKVWGEGLDVSVGLEAKWTGGHWQMEWSPFTMAREGQTIASSTGRVIPAVSGKGPATLKGTLEVDVDSLARQPIGAEWGHLPGRTLTAEFSTQVGAWNTLTARVNLLGRNPVHTASTTLTADLDRNGRLTFLAPIQIAIGKDTSELTAEGTWTTGPAPRFGVKFSSNHLDVNHVRPLAGPLAWFAGASDARRGPSGALTIGPTVPSTPFWGSVPGWVTVLLEKVRFDGREYEDVGGTFTLEPKSLQLEGGHARRRPYNPAKLEGSLAFDPAADFPYQLKASATLTGLDTSELIPMPTPGQPLVWEGKYAATVVTTSSGRSLDDLWRRRGDEFRLSANAGILRLLGTQIADAIPRNESKSKERIGAVADALGELLKRRRNNGDEIEAIPSAISRQAENVLNFTYRMKEFAFTKLEVTAFRTADGTVHLNDILISSEQEHLTGTGRIDGGNSPLTTRPLRLDLKLSLRNAAADGVADTGILSDQKNAEGYARLAAPISLGGTLAQIDEASWREFLLQAALRTAPKTNPTKSPAR